MTEEKTKSAEDRHQINICEGYEATCWAKKFNVSEIALRQAVADVGTSAHAVADYLGKPLVL